MVKKLFTGAPKAGERNCDAIGNTDGSASLSDLVNGEKDYGYRSTQQAGVEDELYHHQRGEPQRNGSKEFDVAATHHAKLEKQRKEQESRDSCAKIIADLGPPEGARRQPVKRRGKRDRPGHPIVNKAVADVRIDRHQQADCQAAKQRVSERRLVHIAYQLTIRAYQKVIMVEAKTETIRRSIPAYAVEGFWVAADGWRIRRIDWPALSADGMALQRPRGSMLFLPGRGDHYEKYLEMLDQFAHQGWAVTSIDWRGQGGSGRLLENPNIGHIDDFSTWIADLKAFWSDWKASTAGPHVVIAHSMGGHLAMRALVERAIDPVALALSAPMLGIQTMGLPYFMHHAVAKFMRGLGNPARAAWKEGEKPGSPLNVRAKILTHDPDRYADELYWWKVRPEVRLGPPSWHWVERAIDSTRRLNAPGLLEQIHTPILLMATTADRLVDTKRIIRDSKRLPDCELLLFGNEAAHELLREADPVRNKCLDRVAQFFEKRAPQT